MSRYPDGHPATLEHGPIADYWNSGSLCAQPHNNSAAGPIGIAQADDPVHHHRTTSVLGVFGELSSGKMVLTEPEKAYLAGLIDGEGCIAIFLSPPCSKRGTVSITYSLHIVVVQVNKQLLQYWQHCTGLGSITVAHKANTRQPNRSQSWQWRMSGEEPARLLRAILPYLMLKKEEAMIALKFRATFGKTFGRRAMPPHLVEQRQQYMDELKRAKKRRKRQSLEHGRGQCAITVAQRPQQLNFTL